MSQGSLLQHTVTALRLSLTVMNAVWNTHSDILRPMVSTQKIYYDKHKLRLAEVRQGLWVVEKPIEFIANEKPFTIPAGFLTDLASIPKIFQWRIPKRGPYDCIAVIHDYLIEERRSHSFDSDIVHKLWHAAIEDLPLPWYRKMSLGFSVRIFGPRFKSEFKLDPITMLRFS